jgi:hypothetical protein
MALGYSGKVVHPFGNLATPCADGAHGFASPPHDGFAFFEDEEVQFDENSVPTRLSVGRWPHFRVHPSNRVTPQT